MGTILETIKEIAETSKSTTKAKTLLAHPELKEIIMRAYNPFNRYYITAPEGYNGVDGGVDICDHLTGFISDDVNDILYGLHKRTLSGNEAMEAVSDLLTTLNPEGAELFKRILNKDLRLGMGVKSINKVWFNLIPTAHADTGSDQKPGVMLCKTFDPEKATYPLIAAVKKDGTRARAVDFKLQTRAGHVLNGFDHIETQLELYGFEKDGELMIPGNEFDTASGLIRNTEPVPNAVLWLFDCPSANGNKLERYKFMKAHIKETDHLKIIPHYIIKSYEHLLNFYKWALGQGEEGLVVYTIDHEYRDARSTDWCRMVPHKKAECKVVGFEEGKGKLKGSLGKIVVEFPVEDGKIVKVKVGTGFVEKPWDELKGAALTKAMEKYGNKESYEASRRSFIWENRKHFKGRLAQLEYKEKTKAGSMRQPRFKGWRTDKTEPNVD